MSLTAIHIRTGEGGLNRTVESWLERHNLPARVFADAYEACVYLVANASAVPDFAFVGADWLTPEEWPIVRYLHDTWPSLAVIVYAGRRVSGPSEPIRPLAVCTSARMLERLLEQEPDNLLRSMRTSPIEDAAATSKRDEAVVQPAAAPVAPAAATSAAPDSDEQSAALMDESLRNNGGSQAAGRMRPPELWLLSGQED